MGQSTMCNVYCKAKNSAKARRVRKDGTMCNVHSEQCKAKKSEEGKSGKGWDNGHNRRGAGAKQAGRLRDNNTDQGK